MVCWPRLQHGHAPCRVRAIHAAMGVVIVFPAFCGVMAPVRQTVGIIDSFRSIRIVFNAHSYYQVLLLLYDCVVKHLVCW